MTLAARKFLHDKEFRDHVLSVQDPSDWDNSWERQLISLKLEVLDKTLPKATPEGQLIASLLLNLQQDYDSMITDLPPQFNAKESKGAIHIGNTNQIGIHYQGELVKGEPVEDRRIACLGVQMRLVEGKPLLYVDNVQGELKETHYGRRPVRRIFGKLNSHFGENWRVGLVRQVVNHARSSDLQVRGKVPGLFYFLGSSACEYPIYSLNYVQTYLRSGLSLDSIEFARVPKKIKRRWDKAVKLLKTKDRADQLNRLSRAGREYAASYHELLRQCLDEKAFDIFDLDKRCQKEFVRTFDKYLS